MAAEPAQQLTTGVTAELYRAAIGPRGQDYYLRHFAKFDADGKTSASWHWPAYWTTLNWLVYRKMWGWALAYLSALLGLALLIFGIGKLLLDYSDATGLVMFLLFLTAAFVLPGLYANAWYYNYCSEKISAALRNTAEVKDACAVLSAQASSKRRWVTLASANVAVLALVGGLLTFMMNPFAEVDKLAQSRVVKPLGRELEGSVQPVVAAASAVKAEPPPAAAPVVPPAAMPEPVADVPKLTSAAQIEALLAKSAEPLAAQEADKVAEPAMDKPAPKLAEKKAEKKTPAVAAARPATAVPVQLAAARSDKPAVTPAQAAAGQPKPPEAALPLAVAQAKPTAAEAPATAKKSKAKRQWFVQAGAFSQDSNAQNVRLKIEAAGLQTSAEPSDTPAGRLIRVRVGPFDAKVDAEKAALQIKALDLPAVLFKE